MFWNKSNQILEEFKDQLFIVEGEITDLLSRATLENLNVKGQSHASAIAAGSALLGQLGSAALAGLAASDEGIDVSEFAIELTDYEGQKHYFRGCFPEVVFNKGDLVKVIAHPFKADYGYVSAIIDIKKNYIWTSQQVERGRMMCRILGIKLIGFCGVLSLLFGIVSISLMGAGQSLLEDFMLITLLICLLVFVFVGWRVGASFDEQSIELEAILKKLGFYKPTMMSLNNYSVFSIEPNNNNELNQRWKDYTYRIDLAQKVDAEKYGKK